MPRTGCFSNLQSNGGQLKGGRRKLMKTASPSLSWGEPGIQDQFARVGGAALILGMERG